MFATPSRIWTGHFNNGAHRFPIYYNPAPYYRPTWNPAMFGGYMRPFTFRWVCEYCHFDVCQCNTGPRGGQTSFGYQCVYCKRNPCACPPCICDVTHEMDVKGKRAALEKAERDRQDAVPKLDDPTGTAGPAPTMVTPTTTDGAAQTLHGDENPEELEFPDEKKPNGGFVDKLEFDQ